MSHVSMSSIKSRNHRVEDGSFTAKVRESLVHLRSWTIGNSKVTVEVLQCHDCHGHIRALTITMPKSDSTVLYLSISYYSFSTF